MAKLSMVILEKFRNKAFWLVDFIKGGIIMKHLTDIKRIVCFPETEEAVKLRNERLSDLLAFASKNVPYYKEVNSTKIEDFPVINKNIIRDKTDGFLVDGNSKDKLFKVVTSGSTGTPFMVYQDKNKKLRNTADAFYFAQQAGFTLGEKLIYFKIWTAVNKKSRLISWLQNVAMHDVTDLSNEKINTIIKSLEKDKSNKGILSYASALEAMCRYMDTLENQKRIPRINSVIAMSESLNSYTKEASKKYFSNNVVSRYSNVENGIIAQQMPNGTNEFVINWASYFVEVLELDNDNQVALGKPGRIVITDLYNYAMPMIRYDTGDIGVLNWDANQKTKVLSNVEGRKMDMVYDTSGNLKSSFTITNNMWLYTEIKQYQFIQKSKNQYLFKLNLKEPFTREEQLINEFKGYFGYDADITVEYVEEIPLLNSGKRRKVINLLHDKNV